MDLKKKKISSENHKNECPCLTPMSDFDFIATERSSHEGETLLAMMCGMVWGFLIKIQKIALCMLIKA